MELKIRGKFCIFPSNILKYCFAKNILAKSIIEFIGNIQISQKTRHDVSMFVSSDILHKLMMAESRLIIGMACDLQFIYFTADSYFHL